MGNNWTLGDSPFSKESRMSQTSLPERSALRSEDTWNAASVFSSIAAWQTEYQQVQAQLPGFGQYRGRLGDGPAILAEALDALFQLSSRVDKLSMYASISASVDATDQEAVALVSKADTLRGQFQEAV